MSSLSNFSWRSPNTLHHTQQLTSDLAFMRRCPVFSAIFRNLCDRMWYLFMIGGVLSRCQKVSQPHGEQTRFHILKLCAEDKIRPHNLWPLLNLMTRPISVMLAVALWRLCSHCPPGFPMSQTWSTLADAGLLENREDEEWEKRGGALLLLSFPRKIFVYLTRHNFNGLSQVKINGVSTQPGEKVHLYFLLLIILSYIIASKASSSRVTL